MIKSGKTKIGRLFVQDNQLKRMLKIAQKQYDDEKLASTEFVQIEPSKTMTVDIENSQILKILRMDDSNGKTS